MLHFYTKLFSETFRWDLLCKNWCDSWRSPLCKWMLFCVSCHFEPTYLTSTSCKGSRFKVKLMKHIGLKGAHKETVSRVECIRRNSKCNSILGYKMERFRFTYFGPGKIKKKLIAFKQKHTPDPSEVMSRWVSVGFACHLDILSAHIPVPIIPHNWYIRSNCSERKTWLKHNFVQ